MPRILKNPCPACHTNDYPRYVGEDICGRCRSDLSYAKAERERRAKEAKDSNSLTYEYHEVAYSTPYYYGRHGHVHSKVKDRIQKAWFNVIMRMASPATGSDRIENPDGSRFGSTVRALLPMPVGRECRDWRKSYDFKVADAEAIQEMHAAMDEFVQATDQAAYEKGHNLLLGLASGDTSVKEFNDQVNRKQR